MQWSVRTGLICAASAFLHSIKKRAMQIFPIFSDRVSCFHSSLILTCSSAKKYVIHLALMMTANHHTSVVRTFLSREVCITTNVPVLCRAQKHSANSPNPSAAQSFVTHTFQTKSDPLYVSAITTEIQRHLLHTGALTETYKGLFHKQPLLQEPPLKP